MKVLLAGHEGSKRILTASSYLVEKYLPKGLFVTFLNYGPFNSYLYGGEYCQLDAIQEGGALSWSRYMRQALKLFGGEFVIFALDDYLLSAPMNKKIYDRIFRAMVLDPEIVAGRLCQSDFYEPHEIFVREDGLLELTDRAAYSVTTQYTIWRKSALQDVLMQVLDPWSFEMAGSVYLNSAGWRVIGSREPALVYPDESSLSAKWDGVRVRGNRKDDIDHLVQMGHLNREDLC